MAPMLGIVFEGCACRAAFYAGVVEVLAGSGIELKVAAGASSGAIAAAALASGRGDDFARLYRSMSGRSVMSWRRVWTNRSPFDMSTIVREALREAFGEGDLRDAPMESLCTVTRLPDFGRVVVSSRDETDFVPAILGSCFLPVLYGRAIKLNERWVIDGGISDNLPLGPVVARGADTILAVVASHDGTALKRPLRPRVRPHEAPVAARVITVRPRRPLAVGAWDFDGARVSAAIDAGREAAEVALRAL
jgi:NTE family protein